MRVSGPGGARSYGFGIVGAGVIAATHATAVEALPNARLVAVTDAVPEAARAFGRARGCAVAPGLGELLSREDIDVVCVCVPSGLHAEVGVQAAAAGKHLVVEKPIDVTLAAADRLIEAVHAAGVVMTVVCQHRFDPGPAELRRLLDAGALGRLMFGQATTKWYRSQGYYDSSSWRGTWALDGGSLMNQGIHYVDLLRWVMGPVAEVTALCATQAHQVEVEDTTLAVLRFRSGAVGSIITSTAIFPGFAQRLEVSGTGGTMVIEDGQIAHRLLVAEMPATGAHGARVTSPETHSAQPGRPTAVSGPAAPASGSAASARPGHLAQISDLLTAIDEGRPPAITAESGRAALEVVCAVYQSAREGRTVTLPPPAGGQRAAPL
jgi:UDP-N-acetyl-2-amino-2-deoxyglucuronate dehydrogenase